MEEQKNKGVAAGAAPMDSETASRSCTGCTHAFFEDCGKYESDFHGKTCSTGGCPIGADL